MTGQPTPTVRALNLIDGNAAFLPALLLTHCTRDVAARETSPGMMWNDLSAPNKTYDNPSAFNASCTFGRAFMRSMKALTFGKGERSNSTRGAQRITV
jgi:hypothetical protein